MFIGILLAMASFVVSYSSLQSVSCASLQTSTVIRTFEERAALIAHRGKVVTITLKGYIFFGSAVKILEDVKSHVSISVPEMTPQQLMEQQLAQKHEQSTPNRIESSHSAAPSETTALLADSHAHTTPLKNSTYDATVTTDTTSFPQLDRSIFSFQRSTSSSLKNKPKSITNYTEGTHDTQERQLSNESTSAAKKLFPDISIPLSPVVSDVSPTPAMASSQGLSVYDMTPEMLQHIIEEKNREFHEHNSLNVGSFHTHSRENSTASGSNTNNNVSTSNTQAQSLARTMYPSVNASSLPSTAPGGKSRSLSTPSGETSGDIEMGASTEVPTPSLLTEGIRSEHNSYSKSKSDNSNSVSNNDTTQVAHSIESARNTRPFPLPVPNRSRDRAPSITAPIATTTTSNTITQPANSNHNTNTNHPDIVMLGSSSRPASATRHVSFDGDLPNTDDYIIGHASVPPQLPPRTASESVLATIWEQQTSRRRRPSLSTSPARAASTSALLTLDAKESPKLNMSESLQILRMPSVELNNENVESVSASPQSFPPPVTMIRERSFQEQYQATKSRRKTGDNIHIPATPPPELVLQSLAREQQHREQQQQLQARDVEQRDAESEIMTEYLVCSHSSIFI